MDEQFEQMEQGHVEKIQQAISLLQEVLVGEEKEVEAPEASPNLRDQITKAMG